MKYVYVLNSFGNNKVKDLSQKLDVISNRLDLDYEININNTLVSTEDIIDKYKDSRNIIVPVGGDGMINRVLNRIMGTNNILGFLPYGTGNDFARTIKETLDEGVNEVDVVRINEKYFINVACFGVDAEIANDDRFVHSKIIPKKFRYKVGVPSHFLNYKPEELNVKVNGEEINRKFTTVVVCNAKYYGGGFKVGSNSIVNDSKIEVYLVEQMKMLDMVGTILSMKNGKHEEKDGVRKITTDSLTISSENIIDSNIDGEKYSNTNFDMSVIPNGIEVLNNQHLIECFEDINKKRILRKNK